MDIPNLNLFQLVEAPKVDIGYVYRVGILQDLVLRSAIGTVGAGIVTYFPIYANGLDGIEENYI